MRKLLVSLMVAVAAFVTPAARGRQGQDFSKVQIKVTRVSGNISMLEGQAGISRRITYRVSNKMNQSYRHPMKSVIRERIKN